MPEFPKRKEVFSFENTEAWFVSAVIVAIILPADQGVSLGPAYLRVKDIAIGVFVLYVFTRLQKLEIQRRHLALASPLILLAAYSVFLLTVQDYSVTNSFVDIVELVELVVFFFALAHLLPDLTDYDHTLIMHHMFLATVLASVFGILLFLMGTQYVGDVRVIGTNSSLNKFLPFGFYYGAIYSFNNRDKLYFTGTFLVFLRILVGRTRSIYLMTAAAVLPFLLLHYEVPEIYIDKKLRNRILGGVTVMVLSVPVIFPSVLKEFSTFISGSGGLFMRPIRYFTGLQILRKNPLGVGFGNYGAAAHDLAVSGQLNYPAWFRNIVPQAQLTKSLNQFNTGTPGIHGDVFGIFVQTGPVGLALFVVFWLLIFQTIFRPDTDLRALALKITLIYFGLQSLVNTGLVAGTGPIIMILLALYLSISYRDETRSRTADAG